MLRQPLSKLLSFAALSVALAACAQPAAVRHAAPAFKLDAAGLAERMANPIAIDWSSRVIASAAVERLRQARPAGGDRRIQALSATSTLGDGFAGSPASGRISPPAINTQTRQAFWVAENGWLLRRDLDTGTEAALPISAVDGATPTDTFPKTNVTLSKDGKRVYLCSAQGNVFALDAQTGKNLINSPYAMGETAAELGFTPAPCVDPVAGSSDGDVETLYAISNLGTLHRFYVDGRGTPSPPYLVHAQSTAYTSWTTWYGSEVGAAGTYVFPLSPVVIRGRAMLYCRPRVSSGQFQGVPRPNPATWPGILYSPFAHIMIYETGVTMPTMAPISGRFQDITQGGTWTAGSQPPVVHVDANFEPYVMFNPANAQVYMGELTGYDEQEFLSVTAYSYLLYVTPDAPDSGRKPFTGRQGMSTIIPSSVAIDPVKGRVFTAVGNCLFQLQYDSTLNTPLVSREDHFERHHNFENRERQWYAKSAQARTVGVAKDGVQIMNTSPPYFDGTHVWMLDQDAQPGQTTRVMLNRFLPGDEAAPTLLESIDLTGLAPDGAAVPDGAIAIDPLTRALFLNTTATGTPTHSRLWRIAP